MLTGEFTIKSGNRFPSESVTEISFIVTRLEIKTTVDFISSLVTINDISVTDSEGNRLPDLMVNSPVNIQSELTIQYSPNQKPEVQPYVYYIQIKQSGEKAFVEYIGKV